jgi:hypothetical protein
MNDFLAKHHTLVLILVFCGITIPSLYFDSGALESKVGILYVGNAAFVTFVLHFCLKNLLESEEEASSVADDSKSPE